MTILYDFVILVKKRKAVYNTKSLEGDSDGYENGLLNRDPLKGPVGSTPTPSAKIKNKTIQDCDKIKL